MLQIPTRLIIQHGWHKYILRQAMMPLLPEKVCWRRGGVDATAIIEKGLRRKEKKRITALLEHSHLSRLGWVHEAQWRHAWQAYLDGSSDDYQALVDSINVEGWLRFYAA